MKKVSSFLMLVMLSLTLFAQMHNPVSISVSQNKLSDSEFEIVFSGKADAGWHVYSTDIADGGPTAATIEFEEQTGVEPVGKLTPKGHVHTAFDEMFGMEVSYMEGEVTFVQKMRITAATYSVKGYLTYGACNDENCLPPTTVDFSYAGEGKPVVKATTAPVVKDVVVVKEEKKEEKKVVEAPAEEVKTDTTVVVEEKSEVAISDNWTPVVDKLAAFGEGASNAASQSLWAIFFLGFIGGLVALLTPCVWPIIPMTVSFFLKRSGDKKKGIRDAATYGISIVVL